MSVKLRYQILKVSGKRSYYLDIHFQGQRWYEWLYIKADPRKDEGFLDFDALIDNFRDGGGILSNTSGFKRSNDLIITNDQAQRPKLLILDQSFDRKDAKVIKKFKGERKTGTFLAFGGQLKKYYYYNWPLYFDEEFPDTVNDSNCTELYNNFHFISDPRKVEIDLIKMDSFPFQIDCDMFYKILANSVNLSIKTHKGIGTAETYEIDPKNCKATANGVTIKC